MRRYFSYDIFKNSTTKSKFSRFSIMLTFWNSRGHLALNGIDMGCMYIDPNARHPLIVVSQAPLYKSLGSVHKVISSSNIITLS
jgi:hypothetical protein